MTNSGEEYYQAFVRLRSDGGQRQWFVDPQLRPRIIADALEQNTNMTEVVTQILCRHFDVPYAAVGRRTVGQTNDEILNVRIPVRVYAALCARYGSKYQDGVRAILSQHYGLRLPARVKHRRGRRASSAAA